MPLAGYISRWSYSILLNSQWIPIWDSQSCIAIVYVFYLCSRSFKHNLIITNNIWFSTFAPPPSIQSLRELGTGWSRRDLPSRLVSLFDLVHFPYNISKRRETFSSEADQKCTMIEINTVWGLTIPVTILLQRQISLIPAVFRLLN